MSLRLVTPARSVERRHALLLTDDELLALRDALGEQVTRFPVHEVLNLYARVVALVARTK